MKLYELTTTTSDDGARIVLVAGRVADHRDPKEQKEWITFQFSFDLPTVRNGALLRKEVLEKGRDILSQLLRDFERIAFQPAPYSARRNDIAHGLVRHIHWVIEPGSRETLIGLAMAKRLHVCLIPPFFRGNKFTTKNRPSYCFTSREINRFSEAFWEVAREASRLSHDLERDQKKRTEALHGKPIQQYSVLNTVLGLHTPEEPEPQPQS
jgi:hypothetical protein